MAQFDLTYSLDSTNSTLNISEDGVYSLTIKEDFPESYILVAADASFTSIYNQTAEEKFRYIIIYNEDAVNSARIQVDNGGTDGSINYECLPLSFVMIPSYIQGFSLNFADEDIVFFPIDTIGAFGDGADVDLQIVKIK